MAIDIKFSSVGSFKQLIDVSYSDFLQKDPNPKCSTTSTFKGYTTYVPM